MNHKFTRQKNLYITIKSYDFLLISTSYLFRNWRKGRDNFLNAKNKIGKK